jgi:uncharacterized membrane protein YuzA (DUF378 family)
MAEKGIFEWIVFVLLIIAGLNLGLLAIGAGDILSYLGATIVTILNILFGLSALYLIYYLFKK